MDSQFYGLIKRRRQVVLSLHDRPESRKVLVHLLALKKQHTSILSSTHSVPGIAQLPCRGRLVSFYQLTIEITSVISAPLISSITTFWQANIRFRAFDATRGRCIAPKRMHPLSRVQHPYTGEQKRFASRDGVGNMTLMLTSTSCRTDLLFIIRTKSDSTKSLF